MFDVRFFNLTAYMNLYYQSFFFDLPGRLPEAGKFFGSAAGLNTDS